ncbi:c-type cytochrome [Acuticoccus yangtzensis]|uniref:c-type cytochrome n=1 Tax=Acuticoccus yangtzensis TaxID=1443441 RepID=UPI00094967DE|nr:cytochrome c family protein [Acuticoccus yangtzensis]ORE96626.1 diheme cytochrome c SoxD [Stappia sp. 22II-S9-Z10]
MTKFGLGLLVAAAVASVTPAIAQDAAKGERVFRQCQACHAIGEGAENKIGPELNNIIGRVPGTHADYKYSPAMVAYGEEHVWDEATLDAYLEAPRKVVNGTKMAYGGLRRPEQRADLIAYLKTFSE